MPKGIPLTGEEQIRRRQEIFDASVHLFLEKGFNETSMREIAAAAKIGKATLYDYFLTKDEILLSFFEREVRQMTDRARVVARQERPAAEKLRRIMQMHLEEWLSRKEIYLLLTREAQRLTQQSQWRIQMARHAYQDLLCRLIEDGIREGAFRPVDPLLATRLLLMLVTPVVFTSRPTGTPQQMMDEALGIFFRGVEA
jgi:TetR/AcrR family transcriptional regulator, cholesterol catabolism regulator